MIDLDKIEADAREANGEVWRGLATDMNEDGEHVGYCAVGWTYAHNGDADDEEDARRRAEADARHIANMSPAATLELVARLRRAERTLLEIRDHAYTSKAATSMRRMAHDAIRVPLGYEDGRTPESHLAEGIPQELRIANPQAEEGDTGR